VFTGQWIPPLPSRSAATFFELVVGFSLAYLTVGESFWLQISRTILIMPMVIAPVAVGTMWRMMFSARTGLINYLLSRVGIHGPDWLGDPTVALKSLIIVDVWEWSPFVMVIYAAALTSLPANPFAPRRSMAHRAGRFSAISRFPC